MTNVAADVSGVKDDVANVSAQVADVRGGVTNIEGKFAGVAKDIGQINKNIDTLENQAGQGQQALAGIGTRLDKIDTAVQECCGSRHSANPGATTNATRPAPVTA
ncbi:hypothetical protein [Paraburkholderia humisilvae]|uniref:hypothetical protein n=1 Tax=Paraburkholderia humisilvae TaxID=627669 RepID=UPI0035E6EAF0